MSEKPTLVVDSTWKFSVAWQNRFSIQIDEDLCKKICYVHKVQIVAVSAIKHCVYFSETQCSVAQIENKRCNATHDEAHTGANNTPTDIKQYKITNFIKMLVFQLVHEIVMKDIRHMIASHLA